MYLINSISNDRILTCFGFVRFSYVSSIFLRYYTKRVWCCLLTFNFNFIYLRQTTLKHRQLMIRLHFVLIHNIITAHSPLGKETSDASSSLRDIQAAIPQGSCLSLAPCLIYTDAIFTHDNASIAFFIYVSKFHTSNHNTLTLKNYNR